MQSEARNRGRGKQWLVIVGIAILLHLVLFLSVKPEFFAVFKSSASGGGGDIPAMAAMPDAIITLEIEIDESTDEPVRPVKDPQQADEPAEVADDTPAENVRESEQPNKPAEKDGPSEAENNFDIETLIGEDPVTRPGDQSGHGEVKIPPRPVEITWPDSDDLEECLGHDIDVRIQVDENGDILRVDAGDADRPEDCIEAALDSARRIVFEPGTVNGIPIKMWTQVRIHFRKKG